MVSTIVPSAAGVNPVGITGDKWGLMYVADFGGKVIRVISTSGQVVTYAGISSSTGSVDGIGSSANFVQPIGIGADPTGQVVFVTEFSGNRIRSIRSSSTFDLIHSNIHVFFYVSICIFLYICVYLSMYMYSPSHRLLFAN